MHERQPRSHRTDGGATRRLSGERCGLWAGLRRWCTVLSAAAFRGKGAPVRLIPPLQAHRIRQRRSCLGARVRACRALSAVRGCRGPSQVPLIPNRRDVTRQRRPPFPSVHDGIHTHPMDGAGLCPSATLPSFHRLRRLFYAFMSGRFGPFWHGPRPTCCQPGRGLAHTLDVESVSRANTLAVPSGLTWGPQQGWGGVGARCCCSH